MQKTALSLFAIVALQFSTTLLADEFVGIRVNAENFTFKSDEWYLTSPNNIPNIQPDPDGPHTTGASGDTYMELLPDTRVTSQDELVSGGNYWGGSGPGPRLEYNVNIPEAGTYTVWVKLYATGTEDNGIHVGINDSKPTSGERIQLCGGKNRWSWTSNQRTNENHCGVTQTISVDVPNAGANTVVFYAREDGFEIDQFILLKETNPDVEDCYPLLGDRIRCVSVATGAQIDDTDLPLSLTLDGNTSTTDPDNNTPTQIDLSLNLDLDKTSIEVGERTTVEMTLANEDLIQATSAVVTLNLPASLDYIDNNDCAETNNTISCQFGDIDAGESIVKSFQVTGLATGQHRIDANASSDQIDPSPNNNSDDSQITIVEATLAYDAQLQIFTSSNVFSANDNGGLHISINNLGTERFPASTLNLSYEGIDMYVPALQCTRTNTGLSCDLAELSDSESQQINATFATGAAGNSEIRVTVESSLDEDPQNNSASSPIVIIDSPAVTSDAGSLYIEAENFNTQSLADNAYSSTGARVASWYRITEGGNNNTPTPDPDSTSAASASGEGYMEILPDGRIAPGDNEITNVTNFPTPGTGPSLSYSTFIAEAGRYYIHALIRANGTQDNTLHFGVDGNWPASAANLSLCNPDGSWSWASGQESNDICDSSSRPYIDVSNPGFYTVDIAQSEDGVEIDKIYLTNDEMDIPVGSGTPPLLYGNPDIDLQTTFNSAPLKGSVDKPTTIMVEVKNNDAVHTAVDVSINIDGLGDFLDSEFSTADDCTRTAGQLTCNIKSIAPGETQNIEISFIPTVSDSFKITGTVASAHNDTVPGNDSANADLEISSGGTGTVSAMQLLHLLAIFIFLTRFRAAFALRRHK